MSIINRSIYQRQTGINSPGVTVAQSRAIQPDPSTYSKVFVPLSMAAARPASSIIRRSPQTRTSVIPASTLVPRSTSTASVFGGVRGGVGPATTLPSAPLRPSMTTDYSSRAAASSDYEARVIGTTASRSASTGVAGGGTALARGGPAVGAAPGGGLDLSGITGGIGSSISSVGTGVMNTVTQYMPLAVKVGAALIGIKILLWLVRRK